MVFLFPFPQRSTNGQAGNMLLITGVIASAVAVAGGKVMLDRSTAQRKANQMAQSMKQSKEIPGSAAMIAKALISLPTHVAAKWPVEWTTEKLNSAPTQSTNMPLVYPLPYVSGAIGSPAQPAASVDKTRDPPAGANWGDFKKDGTLSATVRVFTNDRTQASAQDVNRVMESQSKGGSDAIKRTESRVTYAFRNCDSEGKTSPSFTGIYCASADIKSDNFSGPLDKDGNATTMNEARAELGAIMPPPPPACGGVTPPSQIRPGDSFSLGVTAKGVVVGYEIKYAGKCLLDSYSDTGKRCNGNVQTPKSFPWNRPNASAVHTITNIPTSDIISELGALIGANINQASFEVVLRGVTDSTPPPTCPTTINLPGPVSCEPNTFVVERPKLTPGQTVNLRECEISLKKNTGVGVVEEIAISGNSHDGKSLGTKVNTPNFDANRLWKGSIRCEEEQWKFSATLKRNVNGNISYATCNMTPQVKELKPLCAGVASYSRTKKECELKVDKLPNSHRSLEVLVDGKTVTGAWDNDRWSANLPCLATAHNVPVQLSRINMEGIRDESSCGLAEIKTGLDYCVNPSMEVERVTPDSPNCKMKVKRIGGISQNQIKAVWRNYEAVNGSWNNEQWTSDAFECSDGSTFVGGTFVGHLYGTDNKSYECGSKALDPLPPNCDGFSAYRVDPKSTSCVVKMTRGPNSSAISKVLINDVPAVGTWSGNVWEGSTTCGVAGVTLSGGFVNRVGVQDACDGSTTISPINVLPPNCSIAVSRSGATNQCTIIASGLGQSQPNLKRNNTVVSGLTWTLSGDDTYTTTTTCADNARTAFEAGSTAAGVNRVCKLGIKPWFRQIGNGNQHWFATYAIPGRPLTLSIECEARSWQRIAFENGFQNYNHDRRTWWKWENMCLGTESRYNYTSCGDNQHRAWVNNAWRSIPACNDSWTTYLRVYNPIEPNYPVP